MLKIRKINMMHLIEEYTKHNKVKESTTGRKTSSSTVKTTDSQNSQDAANKEQWDDSTKTWKIIEQLSKSLSEAYKKITELSNLTKMSLDKCNVQTAQEKPWCKFLSWGIITLLLRIDDQLMAFSVFRLLKVTYRSILS